MILPGLKQGQLLPFAFFCLTESIVTEKRWFITNHSGYVLVSSLMECVQNICFGEYKNKHLKCSDPCWDLATRIRGLEGDEVTKMTG